MHAILHRYWILPEKRVYITTLCPHNSFGPVRTSGKASQERRQVSLLTGYGLDFVYLGSK